MKRTAVIIDLASPLEEDFVLMSNAASAELAPGLPGKVAPVPGQMGSGAAEITQQNLPGRVQTMNVAAVAGGWADAQLRRRGAGGADVVLRALTLLEHTSSAAS